MGDFDNAEIRAGGKVELIGGEIESLSSGRSDGEKLFDFRASEMSVVFGVLAITFKLRVQSLFNLAFSTSMFGSAKCCIF